MVNITLNISPTSSQIIIIQNIIYKYIQRLLFSVHIILLTFSTSLAATIIFIFIMNDLFESQCIYHSFLQSIAKNEKVLKTVVFYLQVIQYLVFQHFINHS